MQPQQRPSSGSFKRALTGSLIFHACLAFALWQLPISPAAVRNPLNYMPLKLRAVRALPAPQPAEPPTVEDPVMPEPEPPRTEPDAPPPEPETTAETTQTVPPEPAATDSETTERPEPLPERAPLIPDEVEFEVVHRDAIARVVESTNAEFNQPRFIVTETGETIPQEEENMFGDDSDLDLFDRAAALPRNGALTPGRSSSRIGQRIAQFCNDLTGGFSLFGLVNVCADPVARADLFGNLRPQYMESLPLCTAEEDLELEVSQSGTGAVGTMKCVLVPREARAELYRRYDPSLAGWLPAQSDEEASGSAEIAD